MAIQFFSNLATKLTKRAKDRFQDGSSRQRTFLVSVVLMGMTVAMFGGILLSPGDQILSKLGTDLSTEFVYWREFGFDQLRAGHLPLWNPHVFSGAPFMGGFQSALLYPPNWIYLVLPLSKAINCEIALHVFLLGLFMAMWTGHYHLHLLAVLLASLAVMFGGAFFLHVYAGHLATLDAMAWVPLILLTVDELLDKLRAEWVFVGILAFVMQLLAGHPQTVFNTIVTCAAYVVIRLPRAPHPGQALLAITIVGTTAVVISAVQLWTGLQAASEATRQGGVSFAFAASFSFPPENFLTLLVPRFFGSLTGFPYWGDGYLWEMCPFLGLTMLSMAFFGLTVTSSKRFIWSTMVVLLFLLAVGGHTPLFRILYRYVPGFNRFRSHSKFIFEATLFLAMLAALGMNQVLRSTRGSKQGGTLLLAAALIIGALGVSLRYGTGFESVVSNWNNMAVTISTAGYSGQYWRSIGGFASSEFLAGSRQFAGAQCLASGAALGVVGTLLLLRAFTTRAAYLLALFGVAEVFWFAHSTLTSFPLRATIPSSPQALLAAHPGDYRVLEEGFENSAMVTNAEDIWGYDPTVLKRYSELLTYSQAGSPDRASMYLHFHIFSPVLRLLRLRFIFFNPRAASAYETSGPLPHLLLVGNWLQIAERDRILNALSLPTFDPQRTAILETTPDPSPVSGESKGSVQLLGGDTDSLVIFASVPRPTLLLITDCYSRYWRAVALPGSSQQHYTVLPADYTLMAVPLATGRHLIRLEYAPSGYLIGRWVTALGLTGYFIALGAFLWRKRKV